MRSLFFTALTVVLLAIAPRARGDDLGEARDAFQAGTEAAKNGKWQEAIVLFQRSSALRPHAVTTYNVGYCELMLGHPTRARKLLRLALEHRDDLGELTESAEAHLASAERSVARVSLTLAPKSSVAVDGAPLELESSEPHAVLLANTRPPGPPELVSADVVDVILDPGSHEIVAQWPKGPHVEAGKSTQTTIVGKGADARLDLRAPPPRVSPPIPSQRIGAIVLGSLGAAAAIAGAALGGFAALRWSEAVDACPRHDHCPDGTGPELAGEASVEANLCTASLIVAGASLAGATLLFFITPSTRLAVGVKQVGFGVSW